jgi:LPPG:FO 2-phospho-L-lactate transferase
MAWAGLSLDAAGVAQAYDGLIDGLVADERAPALPVLVTDTLMADATGRRRVAEETLRFAESLA